MKTTLSTIKWTIITVKHLKSTGVNKTIRSIKLYYEDEPTRTINDAVNTVVAMVAVDGIVIDNAAASVAVDDVVVVEVDNVVVVAVYVVEVSGVNVRVDVHLYDCNAPDGVYNALDVHGVYDAADYVTDCSDADFPGVVGAAIAKAIAAARSKKWEEIEQIFIKRFVKKGV
ncbi:MAG: hypothetical protein GY938_12125 [Ketobacter sp.]|nr:hypothetical protein [Ketobacter sp.]